MSLSTISLVLVVAIVVSLIKPFLELRVTPTNPLHDTAIRLSSILVGIIGAAFDYAAHGGSWGDGAAIEALLGNGLVAGVGAVVTYHLLTSSVWDTLAPGTSTVLQPLVTQTTTISTPISGGTDTVGVKPLTVAAITPASANGLPDDFVPYTPPKVPEPAPTPVIPVAPAPTP